MHDDASSRARAPSEWSGTAQGDAAFASFGRTCRQQIGDGQRTRKGCGARFGQDPPDREQHRPIRPRPAGSCRQHWRMEAAVVVRVGGWRRPSPSGAARATRSTRPERRLGPSADSARAIRPERSTRPDRRAARPLRGPGHAGPGHAGPGLAAGGPIASSGCQWPARARLHSADGRRMASRGGSIGRPAGSGPV
jgi:hypothetical protein